MSPIELQKLQREVFNVTVVGDTPLIMHKFSDKNKKDMLDKQMKKAAKGRPARDPQQEYEDSIYYMEDGSYGFPSIAFKKSAVRAGKNLGIAMTDSRGAFHVRGEFSKIDGTPEMREDIVTLNGKTSDLRYRPAFFPWKAYLEIEYNARYISAEQIINMLEEAGFGTGVGDWRPAKDGNFGMFHIETS